jgi:hypothetical protein
MARPIWGREKEVYDGAKGGNPLAPMPETFSEWGAYNQGMADAGAERDRSSVPSYSYQGAGSTLWMLIKFAVGIFLLYAVCSR